MCRDCSRRFFLAALGGAAMPAGGGFPLRLGAPVFVRTEDPVELAREHRRLGYSAAYCPSVKPGDSARMREIEKAFAAENVVIAEVGAWVNLLDPDPEKRRANLRYVTERMAIAEGVGARCCVDIAGSFNPTAWEGRILDEVKPRRSKFTLEHLKTPEEYAEGVQHIRKAGAEIGIQFV